MILSKGLNVVRANNRILLNNISIKTYTQIASKPRTRVSFPVSIINEVLLKNVHLL